MSKKMWILRDAIYVIVIAIINVLFYAIWGLNQSMSAWISYAFIHVAALLVIIAPFLVENGRERALYATVLNALSITYFVIELVMGFVFIILQLPGFKAALCTQLILLGIVLIVFLINMIANAQTAESLEEREANLVYVKESSSILQALLSRIEDADLHKKVEFVYDLIRSSPIKTTPQACEIERQVMGEIDHLCSLVNSGEQTDKDAVASCAKKIEELANERNRVLKLAQQG